MYPLSLHDALPISAGNREPCTLSTAKSESRSEPNTSASSSRPSWVTTTMREAPSMTWALVTTRPEASDRKSTRLNSSHLVISYAVFCLKKKRNKRQTKKLIQKQKRKTKKNIYTANEKRNESTDVITLGGSDDNNNYDMDYI